MLVEIIAFILLYFSIFTYISYKFSNGFDQSKVGFLVANRNASLVESSLAAGASWVLGLALFATSGFGYNLGWAGIFWYLIPQTIGMFIFAWFSSVCNKRIPNGYTLSGFFEKSYGRKVSAIYQVALSLTSLGFISLTFTALTKFLTLMQIDYVPLISGLVVLGTLVYSLKGGLKTNLVTGSLQMVFMLIFCTILLVTGLNHSGWENLLMGLNGKEGYTSIFDYRLLTTFGIVMALTSLPGIVCNQGYYQKSFGQQNTRNSFLSFILGGIFFAYVPLTLGLIGLMAYGSGLEIKDASVAHLVWMQTNLGLISVFAFGFIVLNSSANALDTAGNSFGAIVAHDWIKDETCSVFWSRFAIVSIALLGWAISVLNLSIVYIFLTYGVLRVTIFLVTILAVRTSWLNKHGLFWSIISVAPMAVYLNLTNSKLEAALLGFFVTPVLSLVISFFTKNDKNAVDIK